MLEVLGFPQIDMPYQVCLRISRYPLGNRTRTRTQPSEVKQTAWNHRRHCCCEWERILLTSNTGGFSQKRPLKAPGQQLPSTSHPCTGFLAFSASTFHLRPVFCVFP